MRPRISLSTFRRVAKMEETMMRAVMPRTSASDETPLAFYADGPKAPKATKTFTLTFKMMEARRG